MLSPRQIKKGLGSPLLAANFAKVRLYGELNYRLRELNQHYHAGKGRPKDTG